MRIFYTYLLILSSIFNLSLFAQEKTFIDNIAQANMPSYSWTDDSWEEHDWGVYLKLRAEEKRNPKPLQKRSRVFNFLRKVEENNPQEWPSVLNGNTTWQDLSLFCGDSNKEHYLGKVIDRTFLELGTASIFLSLASPTNDIATLKKRQNITKFFIEHKEQTEQFKQILEQLTIAENVMLSFWQTDSFQHATKDNYFSLPGFKWLNKSRHLLLINNILEHEKRIGWTIGAALGGIILAAYGLYTAADLKMPEFIKIQGQYYQASIFGGMLSHLTQSSLLNNDYTRRIKDKIIKPISNIITKYQENKGVILVGTASASLMSFLRVPNNARWMNNNFVIDNLLHQIMIDVAQYINGMQALYQLIKDLPELASYEEFKPLITFFEQTVPESANLQELFLILKKKTFIGKPSLLSHKGNILRAFQLMHDEKKQFEQALLAMGNIDKFLSTTQLYVESQQTQTPFCFVQYATTEKPQIELQDFWHPLVAKEKIVLNSLILGKQGYKPNLIVTGPNAGGKSTTLKAVATCALMGQTFGIAPARFMRLTPFGLIATYLNITDDIGAGNSLFKAEVIRTDKLLSNINQLPMGQYSFVIFDEIFNGTSPLEGMACAYSVAKHLGSIEKNICLVATHFKDLTNLEQTTDTFANYKVSVIHEKGGSITYPYKLEMGISDQHVAIDILKDQGFDCRILHDAQAIVSMKAA